VVWLCSWLASTEACLVTGGCDCLWRIATTFSGVLGLLKAMEVEVLPHTPPLFRSSLEDLYTVRSKALRHPPGSVNNAWRAILWAKVMKRPVI
jgi:hypothetical protein